MRSMLKGGTTVLLMLAGVVLIQGQQATSKTDQSYSLGPGDVLEIKVFGQPDLSVNAQIDGEGNLSSLPFLQPIKAKCRAEKQIQQDITAAYARLVNEPQVSVRVLERNSHQPATIFGAVRQQARVPVQRTIRLNDLIAAAGGFSDKTAGTIQVLHTEPLMCPGPGEENEGLPLNGSQLPLQ